MKNYEKKNLSRENLHSISKNYYIETHEKVSFCVVVKIKKNNQYKDKEHEDQ